MNIGDFTKLRVFLSGIPREQALLRKSKPPKIARKVDFSEPRPLLLSLVLSEVVGGALSNCTPNPTIPKRHKESFWMQHPPVSAWTCTANLEFQGYNLSKAPIWSRNRTRETFRGHFRGHLRGMFRGHFGGESLFEGLRTGKSTLLGALVGALVDPLVGQISLSLAKLRCKIPWPFFSRKPPALTSINRRKSAINPEIASTNVC